MTVKELIYSRIAEAIRDGARVRSVNLGQSAWAELMLSLEARATLSTDEVATFDCVCVIMGDYGIQVLKDSFLEPHAMLVNMDIH